MKRILIVEDEEPIRELIKLNLSMVGYDTLEAEDGKIGLELINNNFIDLIILDIMIPKIDGYELLPYIVKKNIPVIVVTAKGGIKDKVKGLNLGADDYITKPFESMELIARVNALFRRCDKKENIKKFDDIEIYQEQRKVFKNGKQIELTLKEFELLNLFINNIGIALSREKILQLIWNYDFEGNTRTVDMHVQRLRCKLNTDKITTVYKVGYRLENDSENGDDNV